MSYANRDANRSLVTSADLYDAPEHSEHIDRIQRQHGCSMEVARLAYEGFTLYIPHMWVGTKTRDDGTLKGEGLIYGVMRNLGIGFLSKTTETTKAINITHRTGSDGKRDHQSCQIKFDRLFTRGEENAGNIAILEHLLGGKTNERTGRDVYNHLEVIYQEPLTASESRSGRDEPARFWKVYLWQPTTEQEAKPATPTSAPKTKFTLVKAKDTSLTNVTGGKKVHFPALTKEKKLKQQTNYECLSSNPPKTPPPYTEEEKVALAARLKDVERALTSLPCRGGSDFEKLQLAEEGFETVGKGGGKAK
jgi:hypothetical protein